MIQVWVDGSTHPSNPGPGGAAWLVKWAGKRWSGSAGYRWTTNNRMELTAAVEGLKAVKRLMEKKKVHPVTLDVRVFSDSAYVVNAFNKGWVRRWQRDGFLRPGGEEIKNADLWRELIQVSDHLGAVWEHVRGHNGNSDNEFVDGLAGEAAEAPTLEDTWYINSIGGH